MGLRSQQVLLEKDGDRWRAEGSDGPIRIRFTDHNAFGVMDHSIDVGNGLETYVPMRIIPNDGGAEVLLATFLPGGSECAASAQGSGRPSNPQIA